MRCTAAVPVNGARGQATEKHAVDRFRPVEGSASLARPEVQLGIPDLDKTGFRCRVDYRGSMLGVVGVRVFSDGDGSESLVNPLDDWPALFQGLDGHLGDVARDEFGSSEVLYLSSEA